MVVLLLLGFSSGLPLQLTGYTLKAWLGQQGGTNAQVAAISSFGIAYTLKFLWAPLLDRYRLPWLGRRRGWCLVFQLGLIAGIALLGTLDPIGQPELLAIIAVGVAFLSASQDVIIDAYKADLLAPAERAAGAAAYVLGYRAALLMTGGLALILADPKRSVHLSWAVVYEGMAALMLVGVIATLLAEEPVVAATPRTFTSALWRPFADFVKRLGGRYAALVLVFAATYRFGDYFVQALSIQFFTKGAHFTQTEVAVVNKLVGFAGTFVGGLAAGGLVARFGLRRMLVAFGILAAITNLLYAWLALAGHDIVVFCIAVGVDQASTALGTAAFLAVLMSVTSPAFSATQFALLTSLASVGERVFGPFAANVVDSIGWAGYFVVTAAMALPGLVLAWFVAHENVAPVETRS